MAASLLVCPRQYANSCLSSADGEVKAAAMALMAATDSPGVPRRATCLSEKRARKRTGKGVASEHRLSRRARMVASADAGSAFVILVVRGDQRDFPSVDGGKKEAGSRLSRNDI